MHPILLDAAGRCRQPVTVPGYHAGRPPRNKGRRYPADPSTVEEIIAVMRTAGAGAGGVRLRALIVLLWRAGLRIGEALALAETDLDRRRGAVLIRHGKGDKRREVGMDSWAWEQLEPWRQLRVRFPVGPLLCVIHGPTAGRNWDQASARRQLARTAAAAGVRRRFAPHQLRHAHAVELAHEEIPLVV
ncbi:MAG: tyrosine-type recombinase/integrase, partial [Solirubrobacteraceae bacterium]